MSRRPTPALVVAGTASGVGKTTIATGLMAAFQRRGLRVQGFKAGPDYIDPSYHTHVTGRPSRNLDAWMLPHPALQELYERAAEQADLCIIEGVMGLFDGKAGESDAASTAEVARLVGAPVLLVLDVAKMARSAAAVALGFKTMDPRLQFAGVILNRVGGDAHQEMVRAPLEDEVGLKVLGALRRDEDLALQERYLGLVPTAEGPPRQDYVDRLIAAIERSVDLDAVFAAASQAAGPTGSRPELFPDQPLSPRCRIAVARDAAFSFYYEDSLDLLAAWGAELVPFSPLSDERLPPDTGGVYIGGGFPELFAAQLAANSGLRRQLRGLVRAGGALYGECGGLMYLGRGLTDAEGRRHQMVGCVPYWSNLERKRMTLGYRVARARRTNLLCEAGQVVHGHEFHWSTVDEHPGPETAAYDLLDRESRPEGYARRHLLASYVHLHFATDTRLAQRFVAAAASYTRARRARGPMPEGE